MRGRERERENHSQGESSGHRTSQRVVEGAVDVLSDFFAKPILQLVPGNVGVHVEQGAHVRRDVRRNLQQVKLREGSLDRGDGHADPIQVIHPVCPDFRGEVGAEHTGVGVVVEGCDPTYLRWPVVVEVGASVH